MLYLKYPTHRGVIVKVSEKLYPFSYIAIKIDLCLKLHTFTHLPLTVPLL